MNHSIRLAAARLRLPVLILALASTGFAQGGEDVEVQTSGPVHEGFANPTVFEDSEPYYVDVDPPTLIEETPPQERPTGNAEWVSGYWGYDDESRRWMWISGTWRATPPGYVWISGYWIRTWKGWRYVRGYWAPASYGTSEIEYLPAPPPTLESGPLGYAPWPNAIWVPGNWVWVNGGYMGWMWRPGYWVAWNPDWVWVPASFTWTPYGYVYVEGHWDYSYDHCGLLYAPVYFSSPVWLTAGYAFSPSFVINITIFSGSFFTRPAYHHYYFGDYYAQSNWNRGIYPAFSFHQSKYGYDPIYAHAAHKHGKGDSHWAEAQRTEYLVRRDDVSKRPARTLAQQNKGQGVQVAVASKDAGEKATTLKLERVPDSDRGKLVAHAQEMRKARQERVKIESQSGPIEDKPPENPRKVKSAGIVPGSVVAAAVADKSKAGAPKDPELPKNVAEADPRREPSKRGGKRLRDPSLDLPDRGEKTGDDAAGGADKKTGDDQKPGRRPGFNQPGQKPDDVPAKGDDRGTGKKSGEDQPPAKKAGDDQPPTKKAGDDQPPGRRPGFNQPGQKPDDVPAKGDDRGAGKKSDEDQPPAKKAGDDQPPGKRPGVSPPARKPAGDPPPEKKPGDDQPPTKKPSDDQPPTKKPGDDQQPPKKPGFSPPARKPGEDQPPGKKPDSQPPKKPGANPPTRKPVDDQPPAKKPDSVQPPKRGDGNPPPPKDPRGTKPGLKKPVEQPESQPSKKPGEKPGDRSEKGGG